MKFIKLLSLISIITCVLPLCAGRPEDGRAGHNDGRAGFNNDDKKRKHDDNTAQQDEKRLKSGWDQKESQAKPDIRIAAYLGESNRVKELISQNPALVNEPDMYKRTGLHYAAQRGHQGIVEFLLGQGAEFYVEDREGITPYKLADLGYRVTTDEFADGLAAAKAILCEKTLQYVYENLKVTPAGFTKDVFTDPNAKNNKGQTLLHVACMDDNPDNTKLVTMLVEVGANVNGRDNQGRTPLFLAVSKKNNTDNVATLLANGAYVKVRDKQGKAPLHWAASGDIATIDMLLRKGASVRVQDSAKKTPYYYAVILGAPECNRDRLRFG